MARTSQAPFVGTETRCMNEESKSMVMIDDSNIPDLGIPHFQEVYSPED